ncbi:hypothetical protein O7602_14275 [Micromonospora sp. WMMD1128]|uniref:hypothetical protein n=1 Tax=Micromonospora sp. WMMD1128 TaxID=3015150 RepID=UPI00248C5DEF|nr:hypothetical protein [Micromonospora sp. WMMD1128]WBB76622.1 hypothetical protein O7602_14275 [Micromonospora sp. WMMD1128]
MSPSEPTFHLWVAVDPSRVMTALAPLKVTSSPLRHDWGSITDLRAAPVGPEPSKTPAVIVLCTIALLVSAGLCASGAPLIVTLLLVGLLLALGSAGITSKKPPPRVEAPDQAAYPDLHHTLTGGEEREDFLDLVELAERAGRALPEVSNVIDNVEGAELLAQVLWAASDVLSRRQQLRGQVRRQQQAATAGDAGSRVSQALTEQRRRASSLWDETEAELTRIRDALELAAVAAENAAHEPSVGEAVREAYREQADVYGERY